MSLRHARFRAIHTKKKTGLSANGSSGSKRMQRSMSLRCAEPRSHCSSDIAGDAKNAVRSNNRFGPSQLKPRQSHQVQRKMRQMSVKMGRRTRLHAASASSASRLRVKRAHHATTNFGATTAHAKSYPMAPTSLRRCFASWQCSVDCVLDWAEMHSPPSCPLCKQPFTMLCTRLHLDGSSESCAPRRCLC